MKEKIKEWIFSVIGLTAGAALAAAALENFLIPFRILDGGLNGIGMIINFLTDIPLSILIVILNIPFFIIGFIQLGRDFIIQYAYAIVVFSVLLGTWYSLLCATLIGIIRMLFMGIPPLALTGAEFGALFDPGYGVRRCDSGNRCRTGNPLRRLYRRNGDGGYSDQ